jgi:hypothetical protein
MSREVIPIERITHLIFVFRGQKVMLDSDLADLYGVSTGHLNRAVKRNLGRFPRTSCSNSGRKRSIL